MVATKGFKYPDRELYDWVLNELHKRNINNETIGEIAYDMQHQYLPDLTVEDFGAQLPEILKKREVLNILATGLALDNLANEGLLPKPLQRIVQNDMGVYGVDESLALSLSQMYGSIAVTNYGFADRVKLGVASDLDNSQGKVNTFADDLALALASAVIGRCGHGSKLELDEQYNEFSKEDINYDTRKEETSNGTVSHHNWDLNKFGNELQDHLLNSRDIEDNMEELIDHKYYVDMSVISPDLDSPWLLLISFSDNHFNFVDATAIGLEDLLEYIWSKTGANGDKANISEMIVNLLRENDLLPDISEPTDFNNDDEIKTNYDKFNDDNLSLILRLLRARKDLPNE